MVAGSAWNILMAFRYLGGASLPLRRILVSVPVLDAVVLRWTDLALKRHRIEIFLLGERSGSKFQKVIRADVGPAMECVVALGHFTTIRGQTTLRCWGWDQGGV